MKREILNLLLMVEAIGMICTACGQMNEMDVSGTWSIRLDPQDQGIQEEWWDAAFSEMITLPGSLQSQGFGDEPGPDTPWIGGVREEEWQKSKYDPYRTENNFKWPFWLQPDKYYKGAAWFRKTITIPEDWAGKYITLELERPHWETRVWVDAVPAGSDNSLSTPHVYDLSLLMTPGEHVLTIRVDNRMIINVGPNSHSVSDHTQSNWNGIVGRLKLRAEPLIRIQDIQVYPDLEKDGVKVMARVSNRGKKAGQATLVFDVQFNNRKVASRTVSGKSIPATGAEVETFIPFDEEARLWDEFRPNLYELSATLQSGESQHTIGGIRFGMRAITTDRNRILLNGRPVMLRGTLECAIFPKTGYPPTDIESWKRIIQVCKAHGLNHIRFHSWCPPRAAFEAADELGFYYQVECSTWPNQGVELGQGEPIDEWLYEEADAVLEAYGNHPSFLLFAAGNEPGGPKEDRAAYLKEWVTTYKHKDPRRLVTSAAGWPMIPVNDFHCTYRDGRIQNWGAGLESRINSQPPETVSDYRELVARHPDHPIIVHEIGQWCVYPNFEEMKKYTGVLKARNFEVFRDFLEQKNMLDQAHDFLMASGKLQVLCYKEEIESNLRTENYGGFQLLDLHDFPGQGTALVGVLDPFWDSKPYVTAEEYRRFCAPVVPLARLPKRSYSASEALSAKIQLSQFGAADLENVTLNWSLLDEDGKAVKQGILQKDLLPAGGLYSIGNIQVELTDLPAPAKYSLEVAVENTAAVNDWDIWVYPNEVNIDSDEIRIVEDLDDETVGFLKEGGKVLWTVQPARVKTDVALGFSSIFWNTAWTRGQAPHTLGILCDPEHPALAAFPTEYHSNWQWSEPIQQAATLELDGLPKDLQPIVQVVPDWFSPKKLALVFEARIGGGSLVVCSVDINDIPEQFPQMRQLRSSLLRYMEGGNFLPKVELSVEQIRSLVNVPAPDEVTGCRK